MVTMDDIIADTVLEQAYAWLCKRRRAYPADADVWSFRRTWPQEKATLKKWYNHWGLDRGRTFRREGFMVGLSLYHSHFPRTKNSYSPGEPLGSATFEGRSP